MVMVCVEMEVVMAMVAPGMLTTLVMLGAARCSAAPLLRCSAAALLRRSAAALRVLQHLQLVEEVVQAAC